VNKLQEVFTLIRYLRKFSGTANCLPALPLAARGRKRGGKTEDTQINTQNVSTFHSLNIKI
jgi:hypothetical protein